MKSVSMYSVAASMLLAFVTSGCQAAQSKAEKQPVKQPPAAEASIQDTVKTNTGKPPAVSGKKVIVYYFHGNMRCHTCIALETYAKQAVETTFEREIKKGKLEWKTVNIETAGNEHFNNDYQLYTRSVIVSTLQDGKEVTWKNLDQIWTLIRDEQKYQEYITKEVRACLEGKCL
ncbi:MAG: hypothetical protein JW699_04810 [Chitinispirillaceae bacterium]|nr:hypothetical protein [Chitinispirillaceae bacterium]